MKSPYLLALGAGILTFAAQGFACGIQGKVTRTDGLKVSGSATISTSWNDKKTHPDKGRYTLKLGDSACGQSMDVFINGYSVGRHTLQKSGMKTLNIVLKGSSGLPAQ
ncbi:MAG: hypothetical protein GY862_38015 [Gammaproteobacteria bacterium]|nr:hypothetical protein [Gammaproteobacteria bacterium]